jgi:hypothetical protein
MISRIEGLQTTDSILDKLESRKPGDADTWGFFKTEE